MDVLEKRIDGVEKKLDALEKNINGVAKEMEGIQRKLDRQRDDIRGLLLLQKTMECQHIARSTKYGRQRA